VGNSAVSATILPNGFVIAGRYEVTAFIGSGGFAQVYACHDKGIERAVAIKVLNPMLPLRNEKPLDTEARRLSLQARFRREASCAARIRHPNVVTIHDFGVMSEPPRPYIVMELLEGRDLQQILADGERMTASVALPMFIPCLVALGKGHDLGIVHKDLKPANLVLDEGLLRLVDFGIARVEGQKALTASAQIMGTAQYLAPEYIRSQAVTPAVDVYQMGLILAEVLTGEPVVQEENPLACVMRHGSGDVRPPQVLLDTPLGPLLERALQHAPEDRYANGHAFAEALASVDARDVEAALGELGTANPGVTMRTSQPGLRLATGAAPHETGPLQAVEHTPVVVPAPVVIPAAGAASPSGRETLVGDASIPPVASVQGPDPPSTAEVLRAPAAAAPSDSAAPATPRRKRVPTTQEPAPSPEDLDVGETLRDPVVPPPEVFASSGKGRPSALTVAEDISGLIPPPRPPSAEAPSTPSSGANPGTVVAVALASLLGLALLGMFVIAVCGGLTATLGEGDPAPPVVEPVAVTDSELAAGDTKERAASDNKGSAAGNDVETDRGFVDSDIIPVGTSASIGPLGAPVVIVEFSEFQCPFCSRVGPTLKQLREAYPDDVRLVFKHNPLSFHKQAPLAAEASLAAADQGQFWPFHDKLFANQRALERDDLIGYARDLQLDMGRFTAALDNGTHQQKVKDDQALAAKLGARGTPSFFVNGKKVIGAQPLDAFKEVVNDELPLARGSTYAARVAANHNKEPDGTTPKGRPPANDETVYNIELGHAPIRGSSQAPVTIVEFSDFECPFCKRVSQTLEQLQAKPKFKGKVRLAYKHLPLPFHKAAEPAALASMAAGEQGKFWAYHDKVFANQKKLEDDDLQRYARGLDLDMARFNRDRGSSRLKAQLKADMAQARRFAARGTPHFFVNGRRLSGAQPLVKFEEAVEEALGRAQPYMSQGLAGPALYKAVVGRGATSFQAAD
jgi:protein-disulfide isomerase/tRNA A-37 threonylcarbamoyl transferase component Bud32